MTVHSLVLDAFLTVRKLVIIGDTGSEYFQLVLTHLYLVSHKRDSCKQCRPRSDTAERGI